MAEYTIHVQTRASKEPRTRTVATEEEATADMAELRAAKAEHRDVNLPWLVVHGDDIISAYLEGQPDPRTADELLQEQRKIIAELRELGIDI
jgi:hypothetical protein